MSLFRVMAPCPKCGEVNFEGPDYEASKDRMAFWCGECGWTRYERPKTERRSPLRRLWTWLNEAIA